MNKPALSVICPSINPEKWDNIYRGLQKSSFDNLFELVCVGPNPPPAELFVVHNFRYLRELSQPSRSFQLGVSVSEGKYIAFIPDDIILDEGGFDKCISLLDKKPSNHGVILRYSEGGNNQDQDPKYWIGKTHSDQQLLGIDEVWNIAPCFMYNREYFMSIGGLDCSMEHVNLNGHSIAYFTQANGGQMWPSPTRIFSAGWQPPTESTILYQAYLQNDAPKFTEFWNRADAAKEYKINFDNWRNQPAVWNRRYERNC